MLPSPAALLDSNEVLLPPQPCSITIVGKGTLPLGGRVTSTSSGTPSNDGMRWARVIVGQNRTPFWSVQEWPNGAAAPTARPGSASAVRVAARQARSIH